MTTTQTKTLAEKTLAERQKEQAILNLKELDIYKPYINGFVKEDKVCFFENFGGFWVYQEPEVEKKMKEIEAEYGCKVYAITHEITEFGELYDFLIVSKYSSEWNRQLSGKGAKHYAFAYVWNKDCDHFSEFGTIGIQSFGGGIRRVD